MASPSDLVATSDTVVDPRLVIFGSLPELDTRMRGFLCAVVAMGLWMGIGTAHGFAQCRDASAPAITAGPGAMKTESFDRDPGWVGVNNRSARMIDPVRVRQ